MLHFLEDLNLNWFPACTNIQSLRYNQHYVNSPSHGLISWFVVTEQKTWGSSFFYIDNRCLQTSRCSALFTRFHVQKWLEIKPSIISKLLCSFVDWTVTLSRMTLINGIIIIDHLRIHTSNWMLIKRLDERLSLKIWSRFFFIFCIKISSPPCYSKLT